MTPLSPNDAVLIISYQRRHCDNYYAYEEKHNQQILHSRDIDGINEPSGSFLNISMVGAFL